MATQANVLSTKSDGFVLETFFNDYIQPWYKDRVVSAVTYEKARNEIDLLKKKSKTKKTSSDSVVDGKISVKSLPDDMNSKAKPKPEPIRGASTNPTNLQKGNSNSRQTGTRNPPVTKAEIDTQTVMLENAKLKKKLSEIKEEKVEMCKIMDNSDFRFKEKDQQLLKLRQALDNSKAEVDELTTRLRKSHGDKSHQERSGILDSGDYSRQREMEKFSEIYDNEWSNAFENIPIKNEEKKIGILHGIVKSAFAFCQQKTDEQNGKIAIIILAKSDEEKRQKSAAPRNEQFIRSLDDIRRQMSTETAKNIAQDFTTNLLHVILSGAGIKQGQIRQDVKTYAFKCAEICWLMLVYNPKVSLSDDQEDTPFDQDTYLPYTRRLSNLKQPTVDFYVWPALCRGTDVLVKGVAQPKGAKLREPLDLQR